MINVKAGEKIAILGFISPQNVQNVEKFTDVIDMGNHEQVLAIYSLGDMASENIQFTGYSCYSNGTIIGTEKQASNLTASASANDNKCVAINIRQDDLLANSAQYVKFGLLTGSNTGGNCSVVVIGVDSEFQPASQFNHANVSQVKL